MKKNLLALFALGGIFSTSYAQTNTYINDAVVVKVNPSTLFYNGGAVAVNTSNTTDTTEKIINEGNIQIEGDFSNANTTGKNFVNRYTNTSSYGQLRINDASTVTGQVILERVKPDFTSSNEYLTALPFQNITAKNLINTLTGNDIFQGNCELNIVCGGRYSQTMWVWDIAETEYDAVTPDTNIEPYKRYLLQFKNNNLISNALNSINSQKIGFTGFPSNKVISVDIKSGWGANNSKVIGKKFGNWKSAKNNYGEEYYTYLANQQGTKFDNEYYFGKNLHRFGNPYTSNLDLSNVQTGQSWITFNTTSGAQSPIQVFNNSIRFKVYKIANGYSINWNSDNGNSSSGTTNTLLSAHLKGNNGNGYGASNTSYFWTGNAEALLVKPYETFFIEYNSINPTTNPNGNEIVTTNLNLTDANKTFAYNFDGYNTGTDGLPGVFSKSSIKNVKSNTNDLLNNEDLKARGLVTDFDFTQLELFLTKQSSKEIQGNPTYLLNANFMETGVDTREQDNTNPIFFFEESKDGEILTNSKTTVNSFNNEDYIGKPIRIGFNKDLIKNGEDYKLNLNLYEKSILNKVKNLTQGKYYLLDKLTKKIVVVDEATEISFTADDKINDRFEFYWNEKPSSTLSTDDLTKTNTTYLYSDANRNQFVRFEKSNTTADIAVFDLTGRQIFSKNAVSTNSDYQLNLNNTPSIYVVKITYKDGKTVIKKTIKK